MHDLARGALAQQLIVEVELQRDRVVGLALELVALARQHHERQVVGAERAPRAPSTSIVTSSPRSKAAATARRVERRDRRRDLGHARAEARAERAEVGLHLVRGQLLRLLHVGDPLHVQLVEHLVLEPLDRGRSRSSATTTASRSGWRTLTLAWLRARAAELDRAARDGHVELELPVDQRLVGLREVAQVHRRLGAVEVARRSRRRRTE